jgi:DNA polymerase III alpha subunit
MLTTAKPVHTVKDEPMEFVTFDDGLGLIEAVLFPQVYRERGHVLFDQGPFIFRGKVEEEFGAVTLTLTHLDRLERVSGRKKSRGSRVLGTGPDPEHHRSLLCKTNLTPPNRGSECGLPPHGKEVGSRT